MITQVLPLLVVKALAGGTMVVAFALVAGMLKPKFFAGLVGAAPAVATASLLVISFTRGSSKATINASGMVVGAVGMVAYCLCAAWLVSRLGPRVGSVLGWGVWAGVAFGLYAVFLS